MYFPSVLETSASSISSQTATEYDTLTRMTETATQAWCRALPGMGKCLDRARYMSCARPYVCVR